jgi:uncharacterized protein DUF6895
MAALVDSDLEKLCSGSLTWLTRNMETFDPFSPGTALPQVLRMKAAFELALLRYHWARVRPGDALLAGATAFFQRIWPQAELRRLMGADDRSADRFRLFHAALAPGGSAADPRDAGLARLACEYQTERPEDSAFLRLEARYYADIAGVDHGFESYEKIGESTLLARLPSLTDITEPDAYIVAHTIFYLCDFGLQMPRIARDSQAGLAQAVAGLLERSIDGSNWDLVCELVLAHFCLAGEPGQMKRREAGLRALAQAQLPSGAIPVRSAATERGTAAQADGSDDFFREHYHATLVVALMSLIISSGSSRRGARMTAGMAH